MSSDPNDSVPAPRVVVFQSRSRGRAMEHRLVLDAASIVCHVQRQHGRWELIVDDEDKTDAMSELAAYQNENPPKMKRDFVKTHVFGGAGITTAGYVAIITILYMASTSPESRHAWYSAGRMSADDVIEGQVWRTITALTLHADLPHLISNIAYGSLFGFMSGRLLGGGVGWLTVLVAGGIGNGINAWVRGGDHFSIGASTAVFAALGILVAHALRPPIGSERSLVQRWTPLVGGVLMLSLTGLGGDRTDVGAHVCGFVAGMLLGWFAVRISVEWLGRSTVQYAASFAAIGIIVVAWSTAIALIL